MVFPDPPGLFAANVSSTPIVAQEIHFFILKNPALEHQMIKKTVALAALALVSGAVFAQAAPETTLTFNAGVVTDYRYRGITQSRNEAAVQGGVDYAHKSGFYVGAWASTIKWILRSLRDGVIRFYVVTNTTIRKWQRQVK
jgi:uncharacterized protein (TIGR02001 family)